MALRIELNFNGEADPSGAKFKYFFSNLLEISKHVLLFNNGSVDTCMDVKC